MIGMKRKPAFGKGDTVIVISEGQVMRIRVGENLSRRGVASLERVLDRRPGKADRAVVIDFKNTAHLHYSAADVLAKAEARFSAAGSSLKVSGANAWVSTILKLAGGLPPVE
jgi:hypothetical protein